MFEDHDNECEMKELGKPTKKLIGESKEQIRETHMEKDQCEQKECNLEENNFCSQKSS